MRGGGSNKCHVSDIEVFRAYKTLLACHVLCWMSACLLVCLLACLPACLPACLTACAPACCLVGPWPLGSMRCSVLGFLLLGWVLQVLVLAGYLKSFLLTLRALYPHGCVAEQQAMNAKVQLALLVAC